MKRSCWWSRARTRECFSQSRATLFKSPGPWFFGRKIKSTQSIFVIHTFLKRFEQCNIFDVWVKKLAWKIKRVVVLFAKGLWCVFLFAIVITFPVYGLPWKLSCSLHRLPWNPSGWRSSPNNICDLSPPSLLPFILRNRSNDLVALRCQPSRQFVFKDKVRSKHAEKVKVLICWHHTTLSVDRSKFWR